MLPNEDQLMIKITIAYFTCKKLTKNGWVGKKLGTLLLAFLVLMIGYESLYHGKIIIILIGMTDFRWLSNEIG
jgi:hypothetical protein